MSKRHKAPHRQPSTSSRPPRRRYSVGELFMAGLGLLLLILMVALVASALVGGA
jgi:hypothetical protein